MLWFTMLTSVLKNKWGMNKMQFYEKKIIEAFFFDLSSPILLLRCTNYFPKTNWLLPFSGFAQSTDLGRNWLNLILGSCFRLISFQFERPQFIGWLVNNWFCTNLNESFWVQVTLVVWNHLKTPNILSNFVSK